MKFLILVLLIQSFNLGAKENKVFSVPKAEPQIILGNKAPEIKKKASKRVNHYYVVSGTYSNLSLNYPSYLSGNNKFKQDLIGVSVEYRYFNQWFYYPGHTELGFSINRFKRTIGVFSQRLDNLNFLFGHSVLLAKSNRYKSDFLMGLNGSFLIGNVDQSVFSNSKTNFGGTIGLKLEVLRKLDEDKDLSVYLREGFGNLGGQSVNITTLGLGVSFE